MPTIRQLIEMAAELQRGGRREQAGEVYRQVAAAYRKLGQLDRAIESCQRAIRLQPVDAAAHFELGNILRQQDRIDEAIVCYRQALRLRPDLPDAHCNLAGALHRQGQLSEAREHFERAVMLRGDQAHLHANLGVVLHALGRLDAARESLERALQLDPGRLEFLLNLAMLAKDQGRLREARELFARVISQRTDLAAAHNGLGVVLQKMGQLERAHEHLERAVELEPRQADFLVDLGNLVKKLGRPDEAIACYERTLEVQPGNLPALANRGTARLSLGRFAEGWADYEHRAGCPQSQTWRFDQPLWDGAPLGDRRLLVHCEQGLGDTLQFVRYLPLVRARAPAAILAADRCLLPLLSQSGCSPLVAKEDPLPEFDVHVPLLSLPRVFGTRADSVPADVPYLAADPRRIARWREELGRYPGFKIGIAWQGSPLFPDDHLRSIPLADFAPLAALAGVRLFSLQKGPGSDQVGPLAERLGLVDLGPSIDNEGAFLDTAAVMQSLDLVISSDTAVAHLAGALARPVWLALSAASEWRWMHDRQDSPWYPTMRLFRQSKLGDWPEVFERMAAELRTRDRSVEA